MTRLFLALALAASLAGCLSPDAREKVVAAAIAGIDAARAFGVDVVDVDPDDRLRLEADCAVARNAATLGNPRAGAAAAWCDALEALAAED